MNGTVFPVEVSNIKIRDIDTGKVIRSVFAQKPDSHYKISTNYRMISRVKGLY